MNTREESGNKFSTPEDDYIRDKDGYILGYRGFPTSEEGSDTNNISLDLSPHLRRHPGCAGVSEGSIESDLDETGVEPGGTGDGTDADEG